MAIGGYCIIAMEYVNLISYKKYKPLDVILYQKLFIKQLITLCLFVCLTTHMLAQTATYPATDDEFVGPFRSWLNVKKFGAIGDGVTDATAAIQAALDAIGNANSTASVVYIPAGTYLIKGTLRINYKINVSIIGADPATTIIKWGAQATEQCSR